MKGFFKKSGIYFDTEVKEGSNNAVTSGAVAKAIQEGGGGGGGTTDYTDLTNKPKINNVELSGNKTLESLGIASSSDLTALSSRVTQAESDIETLSDNVGDLSDLTTTDKTSLVNAINEVVAGEGGDSSGGVKFSIFANKTTTGNVSISNVNFVTFTRASILSWFDETPAVIHAIIAMRNTGTTVKVSMLTGNFFVTEQTNSAVTYDSVGVFYK